MHNTDGLPVLPDALPLGLTEPTVQTLDSTPVESLSWEASSSLQVVSPLILPLNDESAAGSDLTGLSEEVLVNEPDALTQPDPSLGELLIVPGAPEEAATLTFEWTTRNASFDNEVGFFLVDEFGGVNGQTPDEPNYAQAALTDVSRQVLFASGRGAGSTKTVTFQGGDRLAFYLIQDDTTDRWLAQTADSASRNSPPVFFSFDQANPDEIDHLRYQSLMDGGWQFAWEDLLGGGDLDFNDVVFTVSTNPGVLEKTPGAADQLITTRVFWTERDARYRNELGIVIVDDEAGRIDGLNPQDDGYAQAALTAARRRVVFESGQTEGEIADLTLPGNSYFAWYLIQDASTAEWLAQNPTNELGQGPLAFFSLFGPNPDHFKHLQRQTDGEYGWEDLTNGGDRDFNDLVFRYEFESLPTVPTGQLSIEDVQVAEGDGAAQFTVSLSQPSDDSVTVDYALVDGTAVAGQDYISQSGTLTFAPGETTQTLVALLIDDELKEDDEVFLVTLENAVNAALVDAQGVGTILDDDLEDEPGIEVPGISGQVFNDEDGDGLKDDTEAGQAGVTVFLDLNRNGFVGADEPTRVTDSEGRYAFENIDPGSYLVWEVVPEGFEQKAPASFFRIVDIGADEAIADVNFGNQAFVLPTGTGAISGFTWEDINANGLQDGLEAGLAGATVYLDLNQNAQLDRNEPTRNTDANGNYRFPDLAAGNYIVRALPQSGVAQTFPAAQTVTLADGSTVTTPGVYSVTLNDGEAIADLSFGNKLATVEIRGRKWEDENGNGLIDPNEPGLAGNLVYLDLDNDGQFHPDEPSAVTDETGQYRFRDLSAGTYTVREIVPLDLVSAFPAAAAYTLTLDLGEVVENIDFGNQRFIQTVENRPPVFTSAPVTAGTAGVNYSYQPLVLDPDNDPLTFTLLEGPDGLTIEPETGLLQWTPDSSQIGDVLVTLQVSDDEGTAATQTFTLSVSPRQSNTAPAFVSQPLTEFANASLGSANGSVAPTQLNLQLEAGEIFADTVSITASEQIPQVDVLLLLDDTGSFAESGPLLVSQFPSVIASLTTRFPDVDFGFGLARYEDYAGVGLGDLPNSNRYLYALNSPIVSSDAPGFDIAFTAALERSIPEPGLGGATDRPEALIEGLFQVATGTGFDGNGDGDTTDNGVAGSFSAQNNVLALSNEVPSFDTYNPLPVEAVRDAAQPALSIQIAENTDSTVARTGTPLAFNEIVSGAIATVGAENIFTFSLTERTLIYMDEIDFSAGTTPNLSLESDLLPSNITFDDGKIADLPPGTYNIVVDSQLAVLTGDYAFRLLSLEEAIALNFNTPVSGAIDPIKETDIFQFEAEVGDIVFLDIDAVFDPISTRTEWRLLNPSLERTQLGSFDESGVDALFRIDESGTQTLLLEGTFAFPSVTTVDYDLEIQSISDAAFDAAGTIGGVGFRPGALPIILATADSETVYQPDGVDTVTGVNGVELPLSSFIDDSESRLTTPGGRGASVQPTIDALNDLGALVIGLGADIDNIGGLNTSGSDPDVAPRRTLEGIATLTGAVNISTDSIDSGIEDDPIDPGDPLYFLISQDSGDRIASGIAAGVEAALTATSFDIDLSASNTEVDFQNLTGVVSGVVPDDQAEFSIELTGDGTAQEFELLFTRPGTGILLGSIPVSINNGYFYAAQAVDPEGDPLSYRLLEAPDGATINSENGQLQWTPSGTGVFNFTLQVEDGQGGAATQSFALTITDASESNAIPVITSTPPTTAKTGSEFSYPVIAEDTDGDALNYYLTTAPEGMRIDPDTGIVTWTPTENQIGPQPVAIRAIDARGAKTSQSFTVDVLQNQLPVFSSLPVRLGEPGDLYVYDVDAIDPDGTDIVYSLREGAPDGMTIDPTTGLIQWVPTPEQAGQVPISVLAADAEGARSLQSFLLTVDTPDSGGGIGTPDGETPVVSLGFSSNIVNIGETLDLQVRALDNESIVGLAVEAAGQPLTLTPGTVASGALNEATVQFGAAGLIDIIATATDNDGNVGTERQTVRVVDPGDTTPPIVELDLTQFETSGSVIDAPTEIIGTVSDENLEFYRLEIAPTNLVDPNNPAAADPDYVVIAEGNTNLDNAAIGQIDPRLFANDSYFVRVVAADVSGNISVQGLPLALSSVNKPGQFTQEFVDLSLPLVGFPIQITRTYSSFEANQVGDFGFGWSLGVQDARIQESVPVTDQNGSSLFTATSFKVGDTVTLTTPDGRRVTFTFDPEITGNSLLGPVWSPRFVPEPGVFDTLEVDDVSLSIQPDGSVGLFLIGFAFNPSEYRLTTRDGTVYQYDQFDGLQSATDLNGNTLTYTASGITSSTGAAIEFIRDAQGRITEIIDPTGASIDYGYDANGDLVGVTDRLGNTTQYIYDTNNPHYLLAEIDPLGRSSVRTEYDDQGQLIRTIDAEGNVIELAIDFEGPTDTQVIADALGNQVILTYDDRGNVIQQVDPAGAITGYTYDVDNNLTILTDALGNTTTYTYDERGNQLTETDALGNTTTRTYNGQSQILTATDSQGNITTNRYDVSGNLLEQEDALGNVTRLTYLADGNAQTFTDPEGNTTNQRYNTFGQIAEIEDALGGITRLTYSGTGKVTSLTTPLGNTTQYDYDAGDRLIRVTDAQGNTTEFEYNAVGDLIAEINALGRRTDYAYNDRGLQTETRQADGTVSRFAYDELDRLTQFVDQNGNITLFDYDGVNRLVAVTDTLGNITRYDYDGNGNLITQTDALGRTVTFAYDALNRLTTTTLPLGQRETRTYDAMGNLASLTNFNGETITYEYDANNLVTAVRLPDAPDELYTYTPTGIVATIADARGTTQFEYDALNQLTQRTDPDGAFVAYTYDLDQNIRTLTTPAGTVNYTYSDRGDLETVVDRQGNLTTYSYDSVGNLITTEFANGVTEVREYDLLNRPTLISNTDRNGGLLSSYTYTLDNVGNRLSIEENTGRVVNYAYDNLYQVTQEAITDPANGDRTTTYEYDAVGNRTRQTDSVNGTTTYTYDANDRLLAERTNGIETTYGFDEAGNLTTTATAGETQVVYTWNSQGELSQATTNLNGTEQTVEFQYNTDGIRVATTIDGVTTNFLLDEIQQQFAQVLEAYGASQETVAYTYGESLISQTQAGSTTFYHPDALGSTRQITDGNGIVANSYAYDAYGNLLQQTGTLPNSYLYTGEDFSSVLQNYYLRARHYDPGTGRFLSRDPFAGFNTQPISLHDYLYTGNNPVLFTDPSGQTSAVETVVSILTGLSIFGVAVCVDVLFELPVFDGQIESAPGYLEDGVELLGLPGEIVPVSLAYLGLVGLLASGAAFAIGGASLLVTGAGAVAGISDLICTAYGAGKSLEDLIDDLFDPINNR